MNELGTLMHDDDVLVVNSKLIAKLINLTTGSGYRSLQKKNWPAGGKTDVLKAIFGRVPQGELLNADIKWPLKVVHYILAKNILPRQESCTRVNITDASLLREVAQLSEIDTARLIIIHMISSQKHTSHSFPYPHLVKRIMLHFGIYRPQREAKFDQLLTKVSLRRLRLSQDPELPTPPASPKKPKPEPSKGKGKVKIEEGVPEPHLDSSGVASAIREQTVVLKQVLGMMDILNNNIIVTHKMLKHQLHNLRVLVAGLAPQPSMMSHLPTGKSHLQPSSESRNQQADQDDDDDAESEHAKTA